jgi:multicomponent Na+:H+ antiporter subunit D
VTIAYIGLFLVGVAMLSSDGIAGVALYIVGDGFVKAALFVSIGIVQHRRASVDEVDLHGKCRDLVLPGVVFAAGGLAAAGLPPFGPFLGKALIEDAALRQAGFGWVPAAMMVASALAAGAILRSGARVFLGLGPPGEPDDSSMEGREQSGPGGEEVAHEATPASIWLPAIVLLAAGLVWGLIPGLARAAVEAGARFADTSGYAAAVLAGIQHAPAHVPATSGPSAGSYLHGAGAALLALGVAGLGVSRSAFVDAVRAPLAGLRALHSGHVGDYVAWTTAGVAVLGGVFGITLR